MLLYRKHNYQFYNSPLHMCKPVLTISSHCIGIKLSSSNILSYISNKSFPIAHPFQIPEISASAPIYYHYSYSYAFSPDISRPSACFLIVESNLSSMIVLVWCVLSSPSQRKQKVHLIYRHQISYGLKCHW